MNPTTYGCPADRVRPADSGVFGEHTAHARGVSARRSGAGRARPAAARARPVLSWAPGGSQGVGGSGPQDFGLLRGEFLFGEHTLGLQVTELLQRGDAIRRRGAGVGCGRRWVRELRGLRLFLGRPPSSLPSRHPVPDGDGGAGDGGCRGRGRRSACSWRFAVIPGWRACRCGLARKYGVHRGWCVRRWVRRGRRSGRRRCRAHRCWIRSRPSSTTCCARPGRPTQAAAHDQTDRPAVGSQRVRLSRLSRRDVMVNAGRH